MKKLAILFMLTALLSASPLRAQTEGAGAADASDVAISSDWQNWTFAGCALAAAIAGIWVVAMDNGQSAASSHSH